MLLPEAHPALARLLSLSLSSLPPANALDRIENGIGSAEEDQGRRSTLRVDRLGSSGGNRLMGFPLSQSSVSLTQPPTPLYPSGRVVSWLKLRVRVRSSLRLPMREGRLWSSLSCSHSSFRFVNWQMLIGRLLRLLWSRFSSSSVTQRPIEGGSVSRALWSSQSCLIIGRFPMVAGTSRSWLLLTASWMSERKLPILAGRVSRELPETVSILSMVRSSMSGGSS
mmetsp:Transcript_687/g.1438  ORF Transcript_687/g.1438 Transcript_687/m.1438 type:complete len:224 (-) Transcript_687:270-941(-)